MKIELPYAEVKKRYAKQANEVIATLRKGKSKEQDRKPEELTWFLDWGLKIEAFNFSVMLAGGVTLTAPKTPGEQLDDTLNCIVGPFLRASVGKWNGLADTVI